MDAFQLWNVFVFADTTLNRDLFRKDDRLNSKVSERLLQIIRERDPRAYFLDRKPKVIFESNQELEEDYEGNQWHFFK